jgi:hypothetical protein
MVGSELRVRLPASGRRRREVWNLVQPIKSVIKKRGG